MLPPLIRGEEKACFAVTEPNAGLDTTTSRRAPSASGDGYVINGQKMWISTAQVADKILLLDAHDAAGRGRRRPTQGLTLFYTDLDRSTIEVREIQKMGRKAVDSQPALHRRAASAGARTGSAKKARASAISCTG